jgi:hypothetical protein
MTLGREAFAMRRRRVHHLPAVLSLLLCCACSGCVPRLLGPHAEIKEVAKSGDPTALCEALEVLIDQRRDRRADREYAYDQIRKQPEETAAYYYALASITGRLVQDRGLLGAPQIGEIERAARKSMALDPTFQDGAAPRLLGTLYVFAPATFLEHGDSETGLELLEEQTAKRPDVIQNHLRLAEAYIALSDPEPATPHLCRCLTHSQTLRPDEQRLLNQLMRTVGRVRCE